MLVGGPQSPKNTALRRHNRQSHRTCGPVACRCTARSRVYRNRRKGDRLDRRERSSDSLRRKQSSRSGRAPESTARGRRPSSPRGRQHWLNGSASSWSFDRRHTGCRKPAKDFPSVGDAKGLFGVEEPFSLGLTARAETLTLPASRGPRCGCCPGLGQGARATRGIVYRNPPVHRRLSQSKGVSSSENLSPG